MGFPGGSDGKESAHNAEDQVRSLGWEDPLEKGMAPYSILLPGEFHGQRSLVGYRPQGRKESDMAEQLSTHTQSLQLLILTCILEMCWEWILVVLSCPPTPKAAL